MDDELYGVLVSLAEETEADTWIATFRVGEALHEIEVAIEEGFLVLTPLGALGDAMEAYSEATEDEVDDASEEILALGSLCDTLMYTLANSGLFGPIFDLGEEELEDGEDDGGYDDDDGNDDEDD